MNFFKKLFGIKETKPQIKTKVINEPEIYFKVVSHENKKPFIHSMESPKDYDISEIKKHSTQIKNKEGFLAAINFVKDFISSIDIDLKELISLLKKTIPYMIKEKSIENSEIVGYLKSQVDRFSSEDDPQIQTDISALFGLIDNNKAIEYLENRLGDIQTDQNKTLDHFNSIIQLAEFYLKNKQGDIAFQTVRRAGLLLANLQDNFEYIGKQIVIAEKSALICLNGQKKPNYADYLHYEIVVFILTLAKDATSFPHLHGFFYRKNICYNEGWGLQDNENFNKALEDLCISGYKKEIMKDIYDFTFNELPVKMGIPKEYLKNDVLEPLRKLNEDYDTNYPKWEQIMALQEKINKRRFDISLPHNFSSLVVKKYYDQAIGNK